VRELLNCGANVNARMKDHATPLFIASQNGHRTVVVILLAAGSNVDDSRLDGATPFWIASQMVIFRYFISYGLMTLSLRFRVMITL
jgi:ankyrin repeat protein